MTELVRRLRLQKLIGNASALLQLDERGVLKPHGIGGHAREIIKSFIRECEAASFIEHSAKEVGAVSAEMVERVAKIVDPHAFLPGPDDEDEIVLDIVRQSRKLALSKANRIIAALEMDDEIIRRETASALRAKADNVAKARPELAEQYRREAASLEASRIPVVAEAWTVRVNADETDHAGTVYEVLTPDGKWRGVVAVDPTDARDCILGVWQTEQAEAAKLLPPPGYAAPIPAAGVKALAEPTVYAFMWSLFSGSSLVKRKLTFTKDDPFALEVSTGPDVFTSISAPLTLATPSSPDVKLQAEVERLTKELNTSKQLAVNIAIKSGNNEARWQVAERKLKAAEARASSAVKALEPFAAAAETASKVADVHGENEFVLSFGPVPVGVIPLSAFIEAATTLQSIRGGEDGRKGEAEWRT